MTARSISLLALVAFLGLCQRPKVQAEDPILGPNDGVVAFQSLKLRRLGFKATIQVEKRLSPGYYSVHIVITGFGAAPADQRLTFRLATDAAGEYPPANGLVVDVPVTIQQGARTTTATKYLPKWSVGQSLRVSIWQDGEMLEDSQVQIGNLRKLPPLQSQNAVVNSSTSLNLSKTGFARECRQDWLLIANPEQVSPEATSLLERLVTGDANSNVTSDGANDVDQSNISERNFYRTDPSALPRDWRGYQSYDVVVMNSNTCQQLSSDAAALRPLRNWILQGGALIVYDVQTMQQTLNRLQFGPSESRPNQQTLASLDSRNSSPVTLSSDSGSTMFWLIQQIGGGGDDRQRYDSVESNLDSPVNKSARATGFESELPGATSNELSEDQIEEAIQQIRVQRVGAGIVFSILTSANTMPDIDAFPTPLHWQLVRRQLDNRGSPMLREGTEPLRGNRRFRQWTVPNVRQPPVYSFIGLLTVFVVLVGPVAYRQTTKHGRSHLMFAIAPILAIVTTFAMLGYGIVSDGFRTKVRIRQLTWVDGKSGDAGERVRATYFAGIRPSGGLEFPGKATVMRQAEFEGSTWEQLSELPPSTLGRIVIRDDAQVFGSSFLPSRDQRQFVFHAPREKLGSVQLLPWPGNATAANLVNRLPFPLWILIARDANGDYWGTRSIEPGESKIATKLDSRSASSWLGKLHSDYRPMAATEELQSDSRRESKIIDPLGAIARQLQLHPKFEDGLFEDWLRSHLQLQGEIPREHFVATAQVSDDVVAVEVSDILDSVRYVFGTLP